MPLSTVKQGNSVVVRNVGGNPFVKKHLGELGFNTGAEIVVVSAFCGNLIVKVKESRFALNSKIASKIFCA